MRIAPSAKTRLAGVVGQPIARSLSPVLFSAWLEAAGIDAVYLALAPREGRFQALVEGLRGLAVGLNITAPFKIEALDLADRSTPRARACGAANLLIFDNDGAIAADNTDGVGLLAALRAADFDPAAGPAVIWGAGGAARGAAVALIEAGAPAIRIVARDPDKADRLASQVGGAVRVFPLEAAADALEQANLILNAIPHGPAAPTIPLEAAPTQAVVMDMVYRPLKTALLMRAQALGRPIVDGLAMLIGQAEPSFAAMFGAPPPPIDVRARALEALAA
jgi:shikimate dehydrogenase